MSDKRISILPWVSIILIILSSLKFFIFYSYYRVPIMSYITLSDIGFVLSNDILFAGMFVLFFSYAWLTSEEHKTTVDNIVALRKSSKTGRILLFIAGTFALAIFGKIISGIITLVMPPLNNAYIFVYHLYAGIGVFICLTLGAILLRKSLTIPSKRQEYKIMGPSLLIISLQMVLSFLDIQSTNAGKNYGTVVVTADSVYVSNDHNFYIGQTQNFLFIHNRAAESTLSLPINEVKKIYHRYNMYKKAKTYNVTER